MAGLLLAVGLIEGFSQLAYGSWQPWKKASHVKVPDLVKLALAIVAGIGAAQALVVSYRRQRITEEDLAGQREQRRLWTERFGAAAAQLGGDHAAVRLAGVYAMAALADEWEEQQQQCIDVLCGYLRLPYDPRAPDVPGAREVRLTIIKVISDHLRDASATSWSGRNFDFTGAVFDGGDFQHATFAGAVSFTSAIFPAGEVTFAGATFPRGVVSFAFATFSGGVVTFLEATFSGAVVSFERAKFTGGRLSFWKTTFSGGDVRFTEAAFTESEVSFKFATFAGGEVLFVRARFTGGEVSFGAATISGGRVSFARATFSGAVVSFAGATFSGGDVSFSEATFSGGSVSFVSAKFVGGKVHRNGKQFWGWPPTGARLKDS